MKTKWKDFVKEKCGSIEKDLIGHRFENRELLIRALTRNAVLNGQPPYPEMKTIGSQEGLDTFGNTILEFIIVDHFSKRKGRKRKDLYTPDSLTRLQEFYGNNKALHRFAKESMGLQKYVIWGKDETARKIWEGSRTTVLADCFEALLGAVYIDKGMKGMMKFINKIKFFKNMGKPE
ncbi:MAG TPA: ribonuclease III domain-containing protein [Methanomicrobiales archaeon]|jgi:ribonuclease-3|nr:ribonuclease III domain-containing protein [Methanomicrobiales archaeon]